MSRLGDRATASIAGRLCDVPLLQLLAVSPSPLPLSLLRRGARWRRLLSLGSCRTSCRSHPPGGGNQGILKINFGEGVLPPNHDSIDSVNGKHDESVEIIDGVFVGGSVMLCFCASEKGQALLGSSPRLEREELKELFEHIVDHHDDFDQDTVHSADGYITHLASFKFCFLLSTFSSIFAHSDVLFGILQNREFDMQFCLNSIEDFCSAIESKRRNFESIYDTTVGETGVPSSWRAQTFRDVRTWYQQLHSGIIDNLLTQLRDRFKDHERLTKHTF
ncbi:hypothetical protein AAFF_G00009170 [Aldrovandia affinis]|uniref:Uncharacterized protein n=1 Tax=Aldrovandia affinis TaxID=143900 RepID=A0AAD7T6A5_9TELE|nr:hypothetical protein AAFF_G00009170 [Aldrovandia affinis]